MVEGIVNLVWDAIYLHREFLLALRRWRGRRYIRHKDRRDGRFSRMLKQRVGKY